MRSRRSSLKIPRAVWARRFSVFLFCCAFFHPTRLDQGFFHAQVEDILGRSLGYPVQIARVELDGAERFILHDVRVVDETPGDSSGVMMSVSEKRLILQIDRVFIEYRVSELLNYHVRSILFQSPQFEIDENVLKHLREKFQPEIALSEAQKRLDLPNRKAKEVVRDFLIDRISIENGALVYHVSGQRYAAEGFGAEVKALSPKAIGSVALALNLAADMRASGRIVYDAARINLQEQRAETFFLQLVKLDLQTLGSFADRWLPAAIRGAKLRGIFDFTARYDGSVDKMSGQWQLRNVSLESSEGKLAAEGIQSRGVFTNELDRRAQRLVAKYDGEATLGPVLYKTFFRDFSGAILKLKAEVALDRVRKRLEVPAFNLDFQDLGRISFSGALDQALQKNPRGSARGTVKINDMAGLNKWGLIELLSLYRKEYEFNAAPSGALRADWSLDFAERARLSGTLQAEGLNVSVKDIARDGLVFFVRDAALQAPFVLDLKRPFGEMWVLNAPSPINVSWKEMTWNIFSLSEGSVQAALEKNRLNLTKPAKFRLWDGDFEVTQFAIESLRTPLDGLFGAFKGRELQAYPISRALNIFPVFGTIDADFAKVEIKRGALQTIGKAVAHVFQGEVSVDDVWARDLASPNRLTGMNIRFANLNMGLLSQMSTFGYIMGVLEGHVERLVLYGGKPSAFELDLHTVKTAGVDNTVGIEAVKNIAIFSGATPALKFLDQGIYKFVDEYHYDALGVKAKLADGILRLEATERRGEQRLFLKGRSFPRIDVVYNQGGGEVLFDAILQQIESMKLGLRKENKK